MYFIVAYLTHTLHNNLRNGLLAIIKALVHSIPASAKWWHPLYEKATHFWVKSQSLVCLAFPATWVFFGSKLRMQT